MAGWDRRISARMQSRRGPPILQPFYDVLKLWQKRSLVVRRSQNFYILFFLVLVVFTGALFFVGSDLLLGAMVQRDDRLVTLPVDGEVTATDAYLAGPYAAYRLSSNLVLGARAAWGVGMLG